MDKQQIERMGQAIQRGLKKADSKNEYAGKYPYFSIQMLCIIDELIAAGYGDTKAAIKEFITKFNENLVISFSLTDSVDAIADRVSECVDSCLLSTAKEYGVVLTKEG